MTTENQSPFGRDLGGRLAERFARMFGTFTFIIAQSLVVVAWITLNITAYIQHWDPYPFILLNLAFSTQAAYAAPLILLAQTRQAARDDEAERKREDIAEAHRLHSEQLYTSHAEMHNRGLTKILTYLSVLQNDIRQLKQGQ